jgi:hypothetical protein
MKAHSAEKKNVYIYKLVFVLLYFWRFQVNKARFWVNEANLWL